MSLVNDMLQDLQARRASDTRPLIGLHAVPGAGVRTLPSTGRSWPAIAVAGVVSILAAVWVRMDAPTVVATAAAPAEIGQPAMMPIAGSSLVSVAPAEEPPVSGLAQLAAQQPAGRALLAVLANTTLQPAFTLARKPEPRVIRRSRATEPKATSSVAAAKKASARPVGEPVRTSAEPTIAAGERGTLMKTAVPREQQLRQDGLTAMRGGRLLQAESLFRELVALDKTATESHLLLHAALQGRSSGADAHAVLADALSVVDDPVPVAQLLARQLLARQQTGEAIAVLEAYRPAGYADLEYEAMLAAAYQRATNHAAATGQYRELVSRKPGHGAWWVGLAISQEAGGDPVAARHSFATALQAGTLNAALGRYAAERLRRLEAGL